MANPSNIRSLLSLVVRKRFYNTTPASLSPNSSSSSFTVQYLINSCGLPFQSALSVSRKLQIDEKKPHKPQSVLKFLKAHSFDNTHIAKVIEKWPTVLQCKVEDNLRPKVEFLIAIGFAGQLLPELIVRNPSILKTALNSHLKPSFEYLKSFLHSNDNIVAAIKSTSRLLTFDLKHLMQPNIDFLIKEGVPFSCITNMILKSPKTVMQKHERMVYAVNAVKDLGLEPKAPMFIHAVRVMLSMSESGWNKKIEFLKSLGWAEETILGAFKRYPNFLACSEEKIRHAMDFYVNTMNLAPQVIISYPKFLMYAIDHRIRPRYDVVKVLESKKLIDCNKKKIQWLLTISEKSFFENYVKKYVD